MAVRLGVFNDSRVLAASNTSGISKFQIVGYIVYIKLFEKNELKYGRHASSITKEIINGLLDFEGMADLLEEVGIISFSDGFRFVETAPIYNKKEFVPPTKKQVLAEMTKVHLCISSEEGDKFLDYYGVLGWTTKGGRKVKDWRAAARNWARRNKEGFLSNKSQGGISENERKKFFS